MHSASLFPLPEGGNTDVVLVSQFWSYGWGQATREKGLGLWDNIVDPVNAPLQMPSHLRLLCKGEMNLLSGLALGFISLKTAKPMY